MDIVTYALLKKNITSALSGVQGITLENNRTIVFTTNEGSQFRITIPTPDLVYVGDTEPPAGSEYELWIDTSSDGTTSLNKAILSAPITATTVIGSVTSGKTYPVGTSLEDILRDILTSYSRPTIVLSTDPTTDVYDAVEDSLDSITTIARVVKGTDSIISLGFFVDGVEDVTITDNVADGGTFSNIHTFLPAAKETFVLRVTAFDGKNNTTVTKTITFIGKSYWGTVDDGIITPTEEDIKGLQNQTVKNSRSLTYQNISVDYGKILYAYPKSLGALTKIADADGRDYTQSYTQGEVTVDNIDYYYYILTDSIGTDNGYQRYT